MSIPVLLLAALLGSAQAQDTDAPPPPADPPVTTAEPAPSADPAPPADPPVKPPPEEDHKPRIVEPRRERKHKHGPVHQLVLYIPNRVLDVLDVVRLRFRLGPGFAVSVRATEWADLYAGAYGAVFVGLPGPRNKPTIKLPVGLEARVGAEVSKLDLTMGPDYGSTEFGVGAQVLIIGFDAGFDPGELVDLIGGIFFWDPKRDDL